MAVGAGREARLRVYYLGEPAMRGKRDLMDSLARAKELFLAALARQESGELREAERLYRQALEFAPGRPSVMNNLAAVLFRLHSYVEAGRLCQDLLQAQPNDAVVLLNLGNCQLALNDSSAALRSFDRALAIKPDYVEVLANRGIALIHLKRFEEALASCDMALAIQPDYVDALDARGIALADLKDYSAAIENYQRLVDIDPRYPYALGALVQMKTCCCDWDGIDEQVHRLTELASAGERVSVPFGLLAVCDSPAAQLQCSKIYVRDRYPSPASPLWSGERYEHQRIRIGYLSADYCNHATAFLIAGLFEAHDRARFELTAVSFGPDDSSPMRRRLQAACERFIDVRERSNVDVANLVRELEIDIAIDLKGLTRYSRTEILAHRAAPIQVNYLGYPGSMGAEYIDYIIADRALIPQSAESHYAEKVVYLPDTYQANDSKRRIGDVTPTRVQAGLPETGLVFCSFNNSYKITAGMFDVWARLLRRLDGSVLWLIADNPTAAANLRREAEKRGVASQRLVFAARVGLEDHLARHRLADLFLDSLPCNAHTTASDALWSGLPVVTCAGATFAGRVAASLLGAVGLPELVTHSLEEYEALVVSLATRPEVLTDIKARLARNRLTHPLFDTDRFRRNIEAAYLTMWERHQRGLGPVSFAVEPG